MNKLGLGLKGWGRAAWSAGLLIGLAAGSGNVIAQAQPAVQPGGAPAGPAAVPAMPVVPAVGALASSGGSATVYQVPLYKSTVVTLPRPAKQVSVGNPGVADILILRARELYVVGKALGSTNVVAWDSDGQVVTRFDVDVTHDLEALKEKLHELLPGEDIKVYSTQERLILSGQVSNLSRMDAAKQIAEGFLPECVAPSSNAPVEAPPPGEKTAPAYGGGGGGGACKKGEVVNLLQVGGAQQVMLKVTVAEMAHTLIKDLDSHLNFFNVGDHVTGGGNSGGVTLPINGANSPASPPGVSILPNTPTIAMTGAFLNFLRGSFFLQAVLDISKRHNLAKILSEPTLTTLTGKEADFLSGGEFPIPVPQGGVNNSTTIEFKQFGVGLKFIPVVLDSGKINLNLNVSVSDISSDNSVILTALGTTSTFVIPSLTERSASSTVELADGQTMGIAGLIDDKLRDFVQKFPGLGDIPVLGALFRSQQFQDGKTELVIFVTPHLARPISPREVRLPTDTSRPPNDLEYYLLGHAEEHKPRPAPGNPPPDARFGHDM